MEARSIEGVRTLWRREKEEVSWTKIAVASDQNPVEVQKSRLQSEVDVVLCRAIEPSYLSPLCSAYFSLYEFREASHGTGHVLGTRETKERVVAGGTNVVAWAGREQGWK